MIFISCSCTIVKVSALSQSVPGIIRRGVFPILLSYLRLVGDVGRVFCCVWYKLLWCRNPGQAYLGLDLCNVSASDAGAIMGNICRGSRETALFFTRQLFQINGPSRRRGCVDLHRRGRSMGVRRDGNEGVSSLSRFQSGV